MRRYVNLAKVRDFREGKIRRYFVDGKQVAIVLWNGVFHSFDNHCPHRQFQLHFGFIEDDRIYCPLHYAVFDLATGLRCEGPYNMNDLPVYDVRVAGEDIQVELPAPELSDTPVW